METGIPAPIDPVSESTFPQQVALILKGNSELDSCLIPLSERVSDIQEEIVTVSRRNFKLEREVDELDQRIKLLIKNKASSVSDKVDVKDDGNVTSDPPLKQTRSHYEHLLFALQEDPCYFARMARIVKGKEVNPFVLLVVLDMYGDQYDTREERLLLQLFELVLREEFESTENIGSLMRHNNATTQMLSAYARRGQGLAVLKTALHGPLTSILTGTVLDLELNPIKIHAQIVADYESTTGLVWDGELQPDHETAVSTPEVMKLVSERIGILEDLCQLVLDSIIGAMDEIPYGMRWVCRKLQQLAVEYFGALNNSVLGSIVGGYIFLRFFTPMIVTPDALKLVNLQANRTQRRTLVLIAKVLQACSNGTLFGDKEVYMVGMNNFIQTNRPRLIEFFGQLTDIDEFHHFVQVDKYIANTMLRSPFISTTLNQLFLVDSLIESNLDLICPNDDDKVRQIMSELRESSPGSPIPVAPSDNSVVRVELVDRFLYDKRFSMTSSPNEIDSFLLNSHHFEVAQDMIRSLLNIAPIDIVDSSMSLADLLDRCRIYGEEHESIDMLDCINDILYALRGITKMSMERAALALNHEVIFQSFAEQAQLKLLAYDQLLKKEIVVLHALDTVNQYGEQLQQQIVMYGDVIASLRANRVQMKAIQSKKKLRKKKNGFTVKSHKELENKKIIEWTEPTIHKRLSKLVYKFKYHENGTFEINVMLTKRGGIIPDVDPMFLNLEDLLEKKEYGERSIELGGLLRLNVHFLLHFLNSKFLAK